MAVLLNYVLARLCVIPLLKERAGKMPTSRNQGHQNKYQMAVHKDKPSDCTEQLFVCFVEACHAIFDMPPI